MEEFIFFDLEKECGENNPIDEATLLKWITYEKSGGKVVIGTNKNLSYIEGMLKNIPLKELIIIAESGMVAKCKNKKVIYLFEKDFVICEKLEQIKNEIKESVENVWIQNNSLGFVVYSKNIKQIQNILERKNKDSIEIIYGDGSVSVVPKNISYENAIKRLVDLRRYR